MGDLVKTVSQVQTNLAECEKRWTETDQQLQTLRSKFETQTSAMQEMEAKFENRTSIVDEKELKTGKGNNI